MFNVNFYSFSKKLNSTARPTGEAVTLACDIKEDCGILAPSIIVRGNIGANNPSKHNYCYIADFGRYYYVNEWTYSRGTWTAALSVDVLATYRTEIGDSSLYVLRSSYTGEGSIIDGTIMDTLYPAKGFANSEINSINSDPWDLDNATLVLGIVGGNPKTVRTGAVQYYAFTTAQAKALFDFLFRGTTVSGNTFIDLIIGASELVEEVVKTTVNPFQYIVSAQYYPFSISGTSTDTISFGWWSLPLSATMLGGIPYKIIGPKAFAIPKHPQAASRGAFLNMEPFSRYSVEFPPFGTIPLDSSVVGDAPTLYAFVHVDCATGEGKLMLTTDSTATVVNVGTYKAQVGVPVQIAQTNVDILSTFSTAANSFVSTLVTPDAFKIGEIANGIGNTMAAAMPQTQVSGRGGSDIDFILVPWIVNRVQHIVDANDDHKGRPACKEAVIKNIAGYVQVWDGELSLNATSQELAEVKSALEGGFYYE